VQILPELAEPCPRGAPSGMQGRLHAAGTLALLAAAGVLKSLSEHLGRARDGELPVRMVVTFAQRQKTGKAGGYYVRPDLIGKVADFDGDRFAIDFTRPQEAVVQSTARRRK